MIGKKYRHIKRGGVYKVMDRAKVQVSTIKMPKKLREQLESISWVAYRSTQSGTLLLIRPEDEFLDGRFEEV